MYVCIKCKLSFPPWDTTNRQQHSPSTREKRGEREREGGGIDRDRKKKAEGENENEKNVPVL